MEIDSCYNGLKIRSILRNMHAASEGVDTRSGGASLALRGISACQGT